MRRLIIVLLLTVANKAFAQKEGTITIMSLHNSYTLSAYKIYEGTTVNPAKHIASIDGNQIIRKTAFNQIEVLYTIVNERIYRSSDAIDQNLLFYFKGTTIFLKTKKGTFEPAGSFIRKDNGQLPLLSYLEPLEYIAFLMALNEIDN